MIPVRDILVLSKDMSSSMHARAYGWRSVVPRGGQVTGVGRHLGKQEPGTETPVRRSTNRADQWHVIQSPSFDVNTYECQNDKEKISMR